MRHKSRVKSDENKKNTTAEETRITPITDHKKKWGKREKKCMRGSEKGS